MKQFSDTLEEFVKKSQGNRETLSGMNGRGVMVDTTPNRETIGALTGGENRKLQDALDPNTRLGGEGALEAVVDRIEQPAKTNQT